MNTEEALRFLRGSPESIDGDTANAIADVLESLVNRLEIARRYIESDAYCPCCAEIRECAPDCTIREDNPDISDTIEGARELLTQLD